MLEGRCEVWWARLSDARPEHVGLLDDQERRRRDGYRRPDDQARFTLGATLLRLTAGQKLGRPPGTLAVDRTCPTCDRPHGRPRVAEPELFASVSHSGNRVAVALTGAGPVGVDVEQVVDLDVASVIDQVTSADERAGITSKRDLFRTWTRKESVLKALGEGLRTPMLAVRLVSGPAPPARAEIEGRREVFWVWDLHPGAGYAGALALPAPATAVVERDAGPLLRDDGPGRVSP